MMKDIPIRRLGKTGEAVSAIGLGGFHLGKISPPEEAIRFIRTAIERGINFIDNCWDYHGGESERLVGEALEDGYREHAFVMTKIDGRTRDSARSQIAQSLRRLRVEYVDLLQLHEVIYPDDPERAFAPGGAMEALDEAREKGLARHVGFTGHKSPDIHLKMLEYGYDWDTVQMPLNLLDAGYDSFQKKVLPVLLTREIGVLGMKPLAAGDLVDGGVVSAREALQYALSLPTDVVITGMESWHDLEQAVEAATTFRQMSEDEIHGLLARVAPIAQSGKYESYKTTGVHDGTSRHPEWLSAV